jgi:hypothetical protein
MKPDFPPRPEMCDNVMQAAGYKFVMQGFIYVCEEYNGVMLLISKCYMSQCFQVSDHPLGFQYRNAPAD